MSDVISLRKPAEPIEFELGELGAYGSFDRWLTRITHDEPGDWIDLRWVDGNPWNAARALGIDADELKALRESSKYECPLAEREYHAIVPVAAIARPGSDLVDIALNQELQRKAARSGDMRRSRLDLSRVEICLLGTGYTITMLPQDGSANIGLFGIPLSSGDTLVVAAWVWFTK